MTLIMVDCQRLGAGPTGGKLRHPRLGSGFHGLHPQGHRSERATSEDFNI